MSVKSMSLKRKGDERSDGDAKMGQVDFGHKEWDAEDEEGGEWEQPRKDRKKANQVGTLNRKAWDATKDLAARLEKLEQQNKEVKEKLGCESGETQGTATAAGRASRALSRKREFSSDAQYAEEDVAMNLAEYQQNRAHRKEARKGTGQGGATTRLLEEN